MKKNVSILSILFAVALLAAPTHKARGETPTNWENDPRFPEVHNPVSVNANNPFYLGGFEDYIKEHEVETVEQISAKRKTATIPKGTVVVGEDDIQNRFDITEIVVPEGVEKIGERAFAGCSALKSVVLPKSLKEIGDSAFEGCPELKLVKIPRNVEKIGKDAFGLECNASFEVDRRNANFSSVAGVLFDKNQRTLLRFPASSSEISYAVPSTVKVVADGAFIGCRSLTRVVLSPGVKKIGERAFFACESLMSVSIPEGVENIGQGAFWGCSALTSVVLPSGIKRIEDETFFACSSLKSVVIPASVQSIGRGAFWTCSSLTSVALPQGVTSLEEGAFAYCSSLRSVALPEGVRSIGDAAFVFCSSLASASIPQSVATIGEGAFLECPVKLRVPRGSYAERWAYANKVKYEIAPRNAYGAPSRQGYQVQPNGRYYYYY